MIAVLGFATLVTFMVAVMRKWLTAFVAIITVPIFFMLIGGFGADLGTMIQSGIETVAPTAVLLLFAVLYFGVMMDAGLFDPVSRGIIKISKGDPVRICVGTAVLGLLVALDGDGTTSYMIICSSFLPIYRRLGMNPLVIATVATMALGTVSGTTPWGGAATRAISVLGIDATEYFVHMLPAMLMTALFVIFLAWILGRAQRRRIDPDLIAEVRAEVLENKDGEQARPLDWRFVANALVTVLLLVLLVAGVADLVVLFICAFVIALLVNHTAIDTQGEVIRKHAANAVPVVMLVLGAGVFTGILSETGMTTAMAESLINLVPEGAGGLIPTAAAIIGIPLSFFMANDAYFFGMVPVLAESAAQYGIPPEEMARAAVIGQLAHSIGPASAPLWVLLGLVKASLGDFQRFAILWVLAASFAYLAFALLTGAISIGL